jgi:hypothetical protein
MTSEAHRRCASGFAHAKNSPMTTTHPRSTAFPAHGSFALAISEQLLLVDLHGPWNIELVFSYQQELDKAVEVLHAGGPWAAVVHVFTSALFTPEAMQSMQNKAEEQSVVQQRVATAFVIAPDVEGCRLLDKTLHQMYAGSQAFSIFDEPAPAMAWATRQIASASAADKHRYQPAIELGHSAS